jgi:fido (protein-threonine AMPylation protein)
VPHPWDTGDLEQNWQGYFVPGTSVLRNRVGATTLDVLQDAENDLVEARVIELRESPDLLICREVCQGGMGRRRRGATPTAPRCFLAESV